MRMQSGTKPKIEKRLQEHGTIGTSDYKRYRGKVLDFQSDKFSKKEYHAFMIRKKKEELARGYAIVRKIDSLSWHIDNDESFVARSYSAFLLLNEIVYLEKLLGYLSPRVRAACYQMFENNKQEVKYSQRHWIFHIKADVAYEVKSRFYTYDVSEHRDFDF